MKIHKGWTLCFLAFVWFTISTLSWASTAKTAEVPGGQPQKVVRTQRLEIVEADGTPRRDITANPGGSVGLRLYAKEKKSGVYLGLQADESPLMTLFDENGQPIPMASTQPKVTREVVESEEPVSPETGFWLDVHSGSVTALATIILVVVTWIYVRITRGLLRESEKQRLDSSQPIVIGSWRLPEPNPFDGKKRIPALENCGPGPALKIIASIIIIDKNLPTPERSAVSTDTLGTVLNIGALGPGGYYLPSGGPIVGANKVDIDAYYQDIHGRWFHTRQVIGSNEGFVVEPVKKLPNWVVDSLRDHRLPVDKVKQKTTVATAQGNGSE